jgi:hypothetical protein
MENKTFKKILEFLEKEDNKKHKYKDTFMWKLKFDEPITEDELNFVGNLNFFGIPITSLPEDLKVSGYLNLMNSYVDELPDGLKVGGNLTLVGTKIKSLPEGLEVGGDLNLRGLEIQSLPKGLKVLGVLYIFDTKLEGYSNEELREMIYPGFIKGEIKK